MIFDPTRQTISIMKACALCDVSRRTIYSWLETGKIEYIRTAGGSIRIFIDTLFTAPHPDGFGAERKDRQP